MVGHENSPCEWVTCHLSEDMGYVVSSMGVFGDPWSHNKAPNHVAKHKATQPNRTQLHANFSEIKKKLQWHGLVPLILRTSHTSLFRTSGVTHHPNCHPQMKDTEIHTWRVHPPLGKTESCGYHHLAHVEQNISSLAPYNKTKCQTTYTEDTSRTTNHLTKQITKQQQSCHALWKNAKNNNTICVQQIWTTIILPIILL